MITNDKIACKDNKVRTIYILLVRTNTVFSRIIHMFTGDAYTHASISFDMSCHNMYSFGRIYYRLPFPGGMVSEGIDRGLMALKPNSPCRLYMVSTDEKSYWRLRRIIKWMFIYRKQYKYNLLGVALCWFKREYTPENRYFCSQFVASSLERSGVMQLDKSPSLYRPGDFLRHKDLHLLYTGTLKGLAETIQSIKDHGYNLPD